ncbi:MAG: hypothetical protein L6246_00440 [Thermodesulfovibrionales bacterium]|nr:hypothetical protein [Thermodesulfovibrionales bacterium]
MKGLISKIDFRLLRYFSVVLKLIPLSRKHSGQNSPFGFRQLRLLALHLAKNNNEKSLMPLKSIMLIVLLFFLFSCTAKRVELPDYEGIDIRKIITERSSIKGVNATFHIEFEKNDSTMSGDAALTLTERTLDLRIYSMGFLMAEIKETDGIIKSSPPSDRNKNTILVEGLRNSILWWLIKNYEVEEQNGNYHIRNSNRRIVIDKKTMLPVSQTIELDNGKELRISYEEPANSSGFWYPSRMKIELSRYVVKLQIKSLDFIPQSAQGQQQQP